MVFVFFTGSNTTSLTANAWTYITTSLPSTVKPLSDVMSIIGIGGAAGSIGIASIEQNSSTVGIYNSSNITTTGIWGQLIYWL